MDTAVCALFDPHGYLARALSVLQSTPSAIEAVTRHPQRRGKERRHFNDTSPLMQATLQGAMSSGEADAKRRLSSGVVRSRDVAGRRCQCRCSRVLYTATPPPWAWRCI
jgi:hypothetical protein